MQLVTNFQALPILFVALLLRATSVLSLATPPAPVPRNAGGTGGTGSASGTGGTTTDQLHWVDLGQTLLNLRDKGAPEEVLMTTRLPITNLSRTRSGPSLIPGAGRGLFAAMDCQQGDLLTCYPGDVLLKKTGMVGLPDELNDDRRRLDMLLARYCIGVTEDCAIMALPELADDMAYAGHLANDGARAPVVEDELEGYFEESQNIANADHVPLEDLHMVTVATRDIQEGEEIYVTYGPVYWMEHTDTWLGDKLP